MQIKPGSVVTVTPNPALDQTYSVPGFRANHMFRISPPTPRAGGKGINVSRWLTHFGAETVALGFDAGRVGSELRGLLDVEGIQHDFVPVAGESRRNVKIVDTDSGNQTELNEPGPSITKDDETSLLEKWRNYCTHAGTTVLAGSLPPGATSDLFARMIVAAQLLGHHFVVVDTSGEALVHSARSKPWLIKPNLVEAKDLGYRGSNAAEAAQFLSNNFDIPVVIVSNGAAGAALCVSDQLWEAVPPEVPVVNAVGSGDASCAGFIKAYLSGDSLGECLRAAVACGTANAINNGTLHPMTLFTEVKGAVSLNKLR